MSQDPDIQSSRFFESLDALYDVSPEELKKREGSFSPLYEQVSIIENRYRDAERINSGAMKEIYRVFDARAGRYIAMAKLHADAPQELFEPFLREACLTSLLDHPNIVTIHNLGVDPQDKRPFFTMKLVEGDSLDKRMEEDSGLKDPAQIDAALRERLSIFLKICDGVMNAHSQKVIHLDLKPSNIRIGCYGEVIICDWGLGHIMGSDEIGDYEFDSLLLNPDLLNDMTLQGVLKGTPGYMAPEQLDENGQKDERTDIYALGAILYSIIALETPVEGSEEEVMEATLKGAIRAPRDRFPEKSIPIGLNAIVMKAMSRDPAKRYQDVEALREDVVRFLLGFAPAAEDPSFGRQLMLLYRRNRMILNVLGLAACLLVATVTVFVYRLQKSEQAALEAKTLAVDNLEQYRSSVLVERARLLGNLFYYDPKAALQNTMESLDRALESLPEEPVLWWTKGDILMTQQKFASAYECFTRYPGPEWVGKRVEAIERAGLTERDEPLSTSELIELMDILRIAPTIQAKLVYYAPYLDDDPVAHLQLVRAFFNNYNPNWTGDFDFDPKARRLRLSGPGIQTLSFEGHHVGCLLYSLPIDTLELEGISFDGRELSLMRIRELVLRDCSVERPGRVTQLSNLIRVDLDGTQLKEHEIEYLRSSGIEVQLSGQ